MLSRIFVVMLLLATAAMALADSILTPNVIFERIQTLGARPTLEAIYDNEKEWPALLAGIATGKKEWLTVANQLHPFSDAGPRNQLELAVGEALEHRPENVLTLALTEFYLSAVCGGPDVDDKRFNSYDLSMAAIAKRQEMLRSVSNATLRQVRNACVEKLEEAKPHIARFYGVQK